MNKKGIILLSVSLPIGMILLFFVFYKADPTIQNDYFEKQRGAHVFGVLDTTNI
ncbi:MAG: hypothetical protein ACI9WO_002011 [Sphingobacteriales bacterium]|jgi:hypothetical protein